MSWELDPGLGFLADSMEKLDLELWSTAATNGRREPLSCMVLGTLFFSMEPMLRATALQGGDHGWAWNLLQLATPHTHNIGSLQAKAIRR